MTGTVMVIDDSVLSDRRDCSTIMAYGDDAVIVPTWGAALAHPGFPPHVLVIATDMRGAGATVPEVVRTCRMLGIRVQLVAERLDEDDVRRAVAAGAGVLSSEGFGDGSPTV